MSLTIFNANDWKRRHAGKDFTNGKLVEDHQFNDRSAAMYDLHKEHMSNCCVIYSIRFLTGTEDDALDYSLLIVTFLLAVGYGG